ncbi:MAG: hypothetical protein GQ570_03295 [Helicobacteraceae bacterium]|nr:hypothetical protein [Helicobacteraceae bacterium]
MKDLRFSDMGYVKSSGNSVKVDLFEVGSAVLNFEIDTLICVSNKGCLSKSSFNEEYLSSSYPDNILQNIFLAKPIFNRENIAINERGFEQNIGSIKYKVDDRGTYFKDSKKGILIKLKTLK